MSQLAATTSVVMDLDKSNAEVGAENVISETADAISETEDINEDPSETAEKQAEVTEGPVDVTEDPADITEAPTDVTKDPADITQDITDITKDPADVIKDPTDINEDSNFTHDTADTVHVDNNDIPDVTHDQADDSSELANDLNDINEDINEEINKIVDPGDETSGGLTESKKTENDVTPVISLSFDSEDQLTNTEIDLLRKEMIDDFASADNSLNQEEISAKVETAFPMAMIQKRAYDRAIQTFNSNLRKAENLAQIIKKCLDSVKRLREGHPSVKSRLGQLGMFLSWFPADVGKKLVACNEEASLTWYGETVVQTVAKLSAIQEKFDNLKVDFDEELDHHGYPSETFSCNINEFKMTPAIDFDVTIFGGKKFAGVPAPAILLFPAWKKQWLETKEILETWCTGCTDNVLYLKLKDCLNAHALDVAVAAKSYRYAINALCQNFESPVNIAGAFFNRLSPKMKMDKHQKACKAALDYVASAADVFANEGVSLREFLGIHIICESMSPAALKDWQAHIVKFRGEYIRAHREAEDLDEKPWKEGYAINQKTFNAWYEAWALAHKNDVLRTEKPSTSVGVKPKTVGNQQKKQAPQSPLCILHKNNSHSTGQCQVALAMSQKQFLHACREFARCFLCLKPFRPGHYGNCTTRCTLCSGQHHPVVCSRNTNRTNNTQGSAVQLPHPAASLNTGSPAVSMPNPNIAVKRSQEQSSEGAKRPRVDPSPESVDTDCPAAPPEPGCLICGPSASHLSADCQKVAELSNEAFYEKCKAVGWCGRCIQTPWSPAHFRQCNVVCGTCGQKHCTSRHKLVVAAAAEKKKKKKKTTRRQPALKQSN